MSTSHSHSHDILIIGAGLAGSILAYQLELAGQKVLLITDPNTPSASRAAAGLINPVTGKRLVLQDHIETLLSCAHQFYHHIEEHFDTKIFHTVNMLRILRSEKERQVWEKRREDATYQAYISRELSDNSSEHDSFLQFQTGYLDINLLLDTLHNHFCEQKTLIEFPLLYDDISMDADTACWHEFQAKKIIFCEGWRGQNNPWFNWLPFQPAKGEILTLSTDAVIPEHILNRGKWLLPTGEKQFKVGATYDWERVNELPTREAKDELLTASEQLLGSSAVRISAHAAGVRPGTKDKQPFIGMHPEQAMLGIFNGFGSKGSLLIPWYAGQFTSRLTEHNALPDHADIRRFRA